MTEQKFKVGDRVRFAGTDGKIIQHRSDTKWTYEVVFNHPDNTCWFTERGEHIDYLFNDRLTLIERPKRMVKKTMWQAVWNDGIVCGEQRYRKSEYLYSSKDLALGADHPIGVVEVVCEMLEGGGE